MADTAALKLGNLISGQISGALSGFAAGVKGSFISANPSAFAPMIGALSKGFGSLTTQSQAEARKQREAAQRAQGFAEERANEQRRQEQISLAIQKGMAINIDEIQKDVRKILDIMSKESIWDKLGNIFKGVIAGLAGLGSFITGFVDEILQSLKTFVNRIGGAIDDIVAFFRSLSGRLVSVFDDIIRLLSDLPNRIGTVFDDIIRFFSELPNRIGSVIDDIIRFFSEIPGKIGSVFDDIGKFFSKIIGLFDEFTTKYLPNTRAAIIKFFSDLADMLKFDALKTSFLNQINKLTNLFNFDDVFARVGAKLNDFIRALDESDIAKFFRRMKNLFSLSLAQYMDELEDLYNNKLLKALGDVKTNIGSLGTRIMGAIDEAVDAIKASRLYKFADEFSGKTMGYIDEAVDALKSSRLYKFGDEFSGKVMTFFDDAISTAKSTKLGTLADDILKIGSGVFKDIGALLKTSLGTITPDVSDLKTFFNLGKEAMNMDELKYVLGEGGLFQKTATMIGKFVGDIGAVFRPIGNFFTGNNLLGQIAGFDEIAKLFGDFGKLIGGIVTRGLRYVPVIGQIITLIEGLFSAFNTEQIAEDLGKEADKVSFKDRIVAGLGGAIASIPGGIIDLVRMAINALFNTNLETSGPDSVQGRLTSFLTKALSDLASIIGSSFTLLIGLITFDKEMISKSAEDIGKVFNGLMKDLGTIFTRYVTLPAKHIYNAAIGLVEGITNWMIDSVNKLIAAAIDSLPSKFETRFGTIELISEQTKTAWKERLSMGKVDMGGAKADTSKDQARIDEVDKKRLEDRARIEREAASRKAGEETLRRAGVTQPSTAGAGRGADPRQFMTPTTPEASGAGYTATDLAGMGLKVRGYGDVQKAGAFISPVTIDGARAVQQNVPGITFTGFNDRFHQEKAPNSSHVKGLAFDFTIPQNLATNDAYRSSIARAISGGTGGKVIDEYARPSALSTGGHFHVDFTGVKSVDLGTGTFAGLDRSSFPSVPAPTSVPQTSPSVADASGGSADLMPDMNALVSKPEPQSPVVAAIDYAKFRESVAGGVADAVLNSKEILANDSVVVALKELKDEFSTNFENRLELAFLRSFKSSEFKDSVTYATAEGHWDAINRTASPSQRGATIATSVGVSNLSQSFDEAQVRQKQYEDERRALQEQFQSQMEGIFRPMVNALKGPGNTPEAMSNAGKNLSNFLKDDFSKLGVKIFGKQYGAAMGGTFQQLAGVYMNEFINESLAPMLGMNAGMLNRAINTYVKGVETIDPQLKQVNASLAQSREQLNKFVQDNGDITQADIVRAAGRKGGFTQEQKQKLQQLNAMRQNIAQQEAQASALRAQKKQFKESALEDLVFGMTGISLGPRTMLDQYAGGAEGLTKDLASFFGAPFKPLFGVSDGVDPATQARLQAESAMQQRYVQGQAQVHQNYLQGQQNINSQFINAQAQVLQNGAIAMQNAVRTGSSQAMDMAGGSADLVGAVSSGIQTGLRNWDEDNIISPRPMGGGTAIPGYTGATVVGGSSGMMMPGAPGAAGGSSGRLMDFGTNLVFNMLGSRLSKAAGGGLGGSIVGKLGTGALRGALTGKGTIAQNIGAQFGLKLGPNVGIMDAIGGVFNSMNMVSSISKGGMNLLQQMMPGGATNAFGQFGFDFFSGMGSSGNFIKNISSAMSSGGSFMGSFGANAAGTGMNMGNFLGQAAGTLGNVMQGMMFGNMAKGLIGGEYSVGKGMNNLQTAGTAIASAIWGPIGGAVAGAVSGLINRAFGRKPKKVTGQGMQGTFTTEGVQNLQTYTDWYQKGGWFRSSKSGRDITAADAETAKAFSEVLQGTTKSVKDLGKILKFDSSKVSGFSKAMNISLTGMNEEQQREAIQKAFQEYGSDLVGYSFKYVPRYQRQGEDAMQTLEALAGASQSFKATNTALDVNKLLRIDSVEGIRNVVSSQGFSLASGGLFGGFGGLFRGSRNRRLIENAAEEIVDTFTNGLSNNAKELQEFLTTYTANFQRNLIEAYGGEEQFKQVEDTIFNLLYTEEEKLAIIRQRALDQMTESATALEAAGGRISPEKIAELTGKSFEETQNFIKGMLDDAETTLDPNNPQSVKNLADIRTAAANFLTAAKTQSDTVDREKQLREEKDGKTPLVFDASQYIPVVDALGNRISTATNAVNTQLEETTIIASGAAAGAAGAAAGAANTTSTSLANISAANQTLANTTTDAATVVSVSMATLANTVATFSDSVSSGLDSVAAATNGVTVGVSESAISIGLGLMAVSENLGILGGLTGLAAGVIGGAIVDTQIDAISSQMDAISAANAAGLTSTVNADGSVSVSGETGVSAQGEANAGGPASGGGSDNGADSGDGDGAGCVDPNVPVYISPNNTKRAGDIIVGDFVYTTHQDTLEYGMYKVIGARILTQPKVLVTLHDKTQIKVSTTHKFLSTDGSWKEMFYLDVGSEIQTMHGGYKTIIHVQDIGEGDVVMLTVDDAHTYIADDLISHNMDKAKGGRVRTTRPYIVGEVGPELFIPNVAGTIVSTDRIIQAVQNASSLDSQTRNLLTSATPSQNPVTQVYLDQESANRRLAQEQRDISVNSAVVDNSVTTVSSPRTNIINRGDEVRSTHPVAGIFTRAMTAARM